MSVKKLYITGGSVIPQPDWNQTDESQHDYIKNKPEDLADFNEDSTHRLVSDSEKDAWNESDVFIVKEYVTDFYDAMAAYHLGKILLLDLESSSGTNEILPCVKVTDRCITFRKIQADCFIDYSLSQDNSWDIPRTYFNPSITKEQVGLGNVDNTADVDKPVSTAQATAIADAKKAGTDAQSSLSSHLGNTSNPHGVTKSQVGLGNVPNVATNDQTPTYTAASSLATLTSGEKLSVSMGKIMKAITDLISHIGNKSNPHNVTAAQAGALPLSGGTLTGNLTGKYIIGTWLQATEDNHLSSASAKIAVLDSSGWVYYRTIDELLADLGIPDATTIRATTSVYGTTKLSASVTSTSKSLAATPYAVKTALDKAKEYTDTAIGNAIAASY